MGVLDGRIRSAAWDIEDTEKRRRTIIVMACITRFFINATQRIVCLLYTGTDGKYQGMEGQELFIGVNKRGRCSCVRPFNPYSAVMLEEITKYP
jgi:hypothetical protein